MPLEKITAIDSIEVKENGCVQIRTAARIVEDGNILSQSFHRRVIAPGENYEGDDTRIKAICAAVHTNDVIASYKISQGA